MLVFPNAKINLGLHICRRRSDGFHDIETIFYPIPWRDALEIVPSAKQSFRLYGNEIATEQNGNLCERAYHLLAKDFELPPVEIHLLKKIPIGAGLGGGSADAAFTLKILNELFSLQLSPEKLMAYAATLGSDCSFFIENKATLATGRGEIFTPINLSLKDWQIFVVYPNVIVNTAWAYRQVSASELRVSLQEISALPIEKWQNILKNDFEAAICQHFPLIQNIIDDLYAHHATYAAMSGSGSAVFALFENKQQAEKLQKKYAKFPNIWEILA
ncbi:MAG: 4-(cytidine 5'-diphospho)-2-C-methyl-D-erythritol kinase [Chitinophagales bacterium]|nr:4-(cytidine 5'-diphospho)-2-C-methyl-D-erythritol kinase [Bacteroidota bacterium]MCB9043092.1 4-(cytidine 5'-diphospho)-2-C-methyl-D-erythritol kinase [Chitinophagales bacterium]